MKRDPALIPLSRDHHQLLLLAQLLKKDAPPYRGLPTDVTGKIEYAKQVQTNVLNAHLDFEEKELIPQIKSFNYDLLNGMIDRLEADHLEIRRMFDDLNSGRADAGVLDQLGRLLERHIRFEEREFFQTVQQTLEESELDELTRKEN